MFQEQIYQISVPAVHAARTILRNYNVVEIGQIAATESNIATLIDVSTQMFRLTPHLTSIVKSTGWVKREDIRQNMERLQASVEAIRLVTEKLPQYRDAEGCEEYQVSAPALHAARALLQHFDLIQKAKVRATEKNLAILIDVCTNISRLMGAIHQIAKVALTPRGETFREHLDLVRQAMRAIEVVRNRLPMQGPEVRITLRQHHEVEAELTKSQLRTAQAFAAQVVTARTVREQQSVLAKSGFVRA